MGHYSIGIDFGTQEARAMLVGMDGSCVRSADFSYPHGVMSECLPDGTRLGAGFALQHPQDYIEALDFLMADLFRNDPKLAEQVIGIGIDFTQCTMMPVDEEGIPLCFREELKNEPYAYVKLWKHHGAQQQARRLTETARKRKANVRILLTEIKTTHHHQNAALPPHPVLGTPTHPNSTDPEPVL